VLAQKAGKNEAQGKKSEKESSRLNEELWEREGRPDLKRYVGSSES
jgi:hypothetical protein